MNHNCRGNLIQFTPGLFFQVRTVFIHQLCQNCAIIMMDQDSQDIPLEPAFKQGEVISRGIQERIFSCQMEMGLRQDLRHFINPDRYIKQPYSSPSRYIPSFEHEHQIISQDPSIEISFPFKCGKQTYQGDIEMFQEVGMEGLQQDISVKAKRFEDELIAEMKQIHPYLSENQIQQAEQNVVYFWQSHQVRPAGLGKILKQCVKMLLLYQAYYNSNHCVSQKTGTLRELQQKYAGILDFVTEAFDNENKMLDKIVPLEKEYFVFRHLNFESFPDHKFLITSQVKKVRSKKKKQEEPLCNTTITLKSNE